MLLFECRWVDEPVRTAERAGSLPFPRAGQVWRAEAEPLFDAFRLPPLRFDVRRNAARAVVGSTIRNASEQPTANNTMIVV